MNGTMVKKYSAIMLLVMVLLVSACGQETEPTRQKAASKPDTAPQSAAQAFEAKSFAPAMQFRDKPLLYIVDSYNPATFEWTRQINAGILAGLERGGLIEGENYQVVRDTIDAYVNATPSQMEAQGRRIFEDIQRRKPDLVLTTDDDALTWVGLKLKKIPVVFNGVNGDPRKYLASPQIESLEKPGHNITGAYQRTYFRQSLTLLKKLVPAARSFGVLTDKTTTSLTLVEVLKQIDTQELPMAWKETLVSEQFPKWQQALADWHGKVDAVYILSANAVKDGDGNLMTSDRALEWVAAHSRLPDTTLWAYQVRSGVLVSATDDGGKQGELSAVLALKILRGTNPGDLSITTPPNGVPALNLARAAALDIQVPQDLMALFIDQGVIFKQ